MPFKQNCPSIIVLTNIGMRRRELLREFIHTIEYDNIEGSESLFHWNSPSEFIISFHCGVTICLIRLLHQLAFRDPDIDAIYLLTDGKPDTSTSMVLREVAKMNERRNINVNTISFNCTDRLVDRAFCTGSMCCSCRD